MKNLDSYSEFAVGIILWRFPQWAEYAKPTKEGAVEFEIPCPSTAVDSGLWISPENNKLTVGFHTDHCHFTDYESPQNLSVIHQGLDFVVEILKDRRGILSWYHGDQLVHTTTIQLPHSGPLPCLLSNCPRSTLRCWSGKFDKDEGSP